MPVKKDDRASFKVPDRTSIAGPNCPDCGTRLSIVPVEIAITLSALETMQLRRRQQAEFAAAESRRLSLPHHPAH